MGAEYSFYVKTITTYAPTFLEYNNSVLAIVNADSAWAETLSFALGAWSYEHD